MSKKKQHMVTGNTIGDKGAFMLSDSIKGNKTMRVMSLSGLFQNELPNHLTFKSLFYKQETLLE